MHSWGWCKLSVTSGFYEEKKHLIHEFCVRCFYVHRTQRGASYTHNDHYMYAGWYIYKFWAKIFFKCYLCVFECTFTGVHVPKNMYWTHKKRYIKCLLCIFGFIDALLHQMNSRSKLVVIKWKLIYRQKHRGTSYIFDRPWLNGASSNRFTPLQSRIEVQWVGIEHRMYNVPTAQIPITQYALLQTKSWYGKFNIQYHSTDE